MAVITQNIVSIQGEGPNIGQPCLIIRFAGCNLKCPWCDTAWNNTKDIVDKSMDISEYVSFPCNIKNGIGEKLYLEYLEKKFFNKYKINLLMFTGGEPFFNLPLIEKIIQKFKDKIKFVDIETNGTLITKYHLDILESCNFKINLSISPKIDKSCYENKDLNIIDMFKNRFLVFDQVNWKNIEYVYKFVYIKKLENKLDEFITELELDDNKIMIMPFTPKNTIKHFIQEFRKSAINTIKYCVKRGYRFSPREQVILFSDDKNELSKYLDI